MLKAIIRSIALVAICIAGVQAAAAAPCDVSVAGNNNKVYTICIAGAGQSNAAPSLWDHNGSVMRLAAKGATRQFIYEQPRQGLQAAAVTQGTLLFTGIKQGTLYTGTAFIFRSGCAPAPYQVSGRIGADNRGVTMYGTRPFLDSACNVVETRPDTLTFSFLGK